jgi:hypothetical protein
MAAIFIWSNGCFDGCSAIFSELAGNCTDPASNRHPIHAETHPAVLSTNVRLADE